MFVLVLTSFHSVDTPEAQWPNECVLHGKKAASAKIWLILNYNTLQHDPPTQTYMEIITIALYTP